MRTSWASWSSVDVMYTQPPQERVRMMPVMKTTSGRQEERVRCTRYCNAPNAKRGPDMMQGQNRLYSWRLNHFTRVQCDEYLEDATFRVPVSNPACETRSFNQRRLKTQTRLTLQTQTETIHEDTLQRRSSQFSCSETDSLGRVPSQTRGDPGSYELARCPTRGV